MNVPIRRAATAALVLFGMLFVNLNYVQVVRASALRSDPSNTRLLLETYSRERGAILAGERAIATSMETTDRLKYRRVYADGDARLAAIFAPLTGYYSIVYGSSSVERTYDDVLSGNDGRLFVRRVSDIITGRVPQGGSVTLTIDAALQQLASRLLAGNRGAIVALDPGTGAVLALATSPSYDPNALSSHDPALIRRNYERLLDDPARPMLSRGNQSVYPPGSTFKIITAAAALERGLRPDALVACPRRLRLPLTSSTIGNFGNAPCSAERVPLALAFQKSYNTAFGGLGLSLGAAALQTQAERFGFNARPDFPLPLAESVFPAGINAPQSAQSAIGQFDVRATPLQMALVAAAIANRGVTMAPYVVSTVRAPDLAVLDSTRPRELGRAVSAETAAALAAMMESVVAAGTGRNARVPGVRVAGKTGTAQNADPRPHTWFVGFAPVEAPRIALAVLIENGGTDDNPTGGRVAAPIARDLFAAYLRTGA